MTTAYLDGAAVTFRNFNVCPHCQSLGEQPLLARLCEGLPMVSRSDGSSFHLLLADRPLPYPNERSTGPTRKISVCFWYSHISRPRVTGSTIVTLDSAETNRPRVFRAIETLADQLAELLAELGYLQEFYEWSGDTADVLEATS
jgi:hypothetical protein